MRLIVDRIQNILTSRTFPHWESPTRAVWHGLAVGLGTYLILSVLLSAWLHHVFEGRADGPFLISEQFGVPAIEAEHGIRPVLPERVPGWDGQFYYHIANDPLGWGDAPTHMDNAAYRYQRVGVPALAWGMARLTGHDWTPPWAYHQVQLILIAMGMGLLTGWLVSQGVSAWLGLTWLGACGPLFAFAHGLPDPAADAIFVAVLVALWTRRLGWYMAAMSLLLLVREGYVVVAFGVWACTVLNWLTWGERRYVSRFVLTALPGAVLLAWTGYLEWHFPEGPLSAERSPSGLYGLPFEACGRSLADQFRTGDSAGLGYTLLTAITLAVVGLAALRRIRSPMFACLLPYLILTASLGPIIWSAPEGYMKALGPVLVIGLFLLPTSGGVMGVVIRFLLIANLVAGLQWNLVRNVASAGWYSPNMCLVPENGSPVPESPERDPRSPYLAPVEWLDARPELTPTNADGWWRRFHREAVPWRVHITNHTHDVWDTTSRMGHILFDREGHAVESYTVPIESPWPPGESREVDLWVRLAKPGRYFLQMSMYHPADGWFYQHDPACGGFYPIKVK